nr:hypothetical protein [Tanacetum cinerariifolium]
MLLNVDHLQKQLDKAEFQEDGSMTAFWGVNNQFTKFIDSHVTLDYDSQITDKYFVEYTGIEVKHFRDTLLQYMGDVKKSIFERARHQRQYDRRVNKRLMQTQESKINMGKAVNDDLVVTQSSGTESEVQDDNSRSRNDTDANDADIRPIYDEEPLAKVQLTTECNIFAIGQQHTEQPKIINEGRVDQYPEQRQVKSPMFDSSLDSLANDYSKQSLESENSLLKQTIVQFQKDFSRMEAHCIALELKYQNQALKSGQHGQVLNDESNKAKIKKEIDVLETINIELEHKTTSLLAKNADLKAQIQEKVFVIAALKNDLRKLKENSVDTKFAKISVLGKPVVQTLRNQSVVRQPNAFKYERPPMNSSKNMPRFSSNDMVHNHYLDEAKKKTQERDRNSIPSVMTPARFQSTTADSKPKPSSIIHSSRSLPMSKSSCVTIPAMPKADHPKSPMNSRAKIQSYKIKERNKRVDQKSHTQIPGRQIFTEHKFSPNKTSTVYEKISPRSDLRWKPTGRIFKSVGLRWLPTGKLFDSCTNKVKSEPPHGSNVDISKIHEYKQTLDLSAGTSINVLKEQILNVSAGILWNVNKTMASDQSSSDPAPECQTMASDQRSSDPAPECQTMASDQNSSDPAPECQTTALNRDSLSPAIQRQEKVTQADRTVTTSNELDLLFSPVFDELLNGSSKVASQSSAVSAADAPNQRQQLTTPLTNHTTPAPTCQIPTLAPTVISSENINQAETYVENDQVADDEFINIFSTPVQDQRETSSRHVDSSNMHTFYQ